MQMSDHEKFEKVQKESLELFEKKNADYGAAFRAGGAAGTVLRLREKLERYVTVTSKSVSLVEDETIRDTLLDIVNYATMALMLYDENTNAESSPKEEKLSNFSGGTNKLLEPLSSADLEKLADEFEQKLEQFKQARELESLFKNRNIQQCCPCCTKY